MCAVLLLGLRWACSTGAACADPITRITISGPMIRAASRHASRPGPVRLRAVPRRRDSRHWSLLTGQTAPTCRVRPSSLRVGFAFARPIVRVGDRRYRVPRLPIGGGAAGCVNKTLTLCVWYCTDETTVYVICGSRASAVAARRRGHATYTAHSAHATSRLRSLSRGRMECHSVIRLDGTAHGGHTRRAAAKTQRLGLYVSRRDSTRLCLVRDHSTYAAPHASVH